MGNAAESYTRVRTEGEEEPEEAKISLRYLLTLDGLTEDAAYYAANEDQLNARISRKQFEDRNRPMQITIILGKEEDGKN